MNLENFSGRLQQSTKLGRLHYTKRNFLVKAFSKISIVCYCWLNHLGDVE